MFFLRSRDFCDFFFVLIAGEIYGKSYFLLTHIFQRADSAVFCFQCANTVAVLSPRLTSNVSIYVLHQEAECAIITNAVHEHVAEH